MKRNEKKEIIYHVINSLLAGALVLLGSFTTAKAFTLEGLFFAFVTTSIVIISKFKEYWDSEKKDYTTKCFNFVSP